jgi:probable HAF family extracellular repeat protein
VRRPFAASPAPTLALLLLALPPAARAATLLDLQSLFISDEFVSQATALSGDGQVLGGVGSPSLRPWILFADFTGGFLSNGSGAVAGLSADGSVAVGTINGTAFRWTATTGFVALGSLEAPPSNAGSATDVSADGLRIVGFSPSPGGTLSFDEAFLYTVTDPATGAGVLEGLGDLPGGDTYGQATAISGDGTTVVGGSSSVNSSGGAAGFPLSNEAFRWTRATGMQPLGDLPGGGYYSFATGVSADGSVVVGGSTSSASGINDLEAFRWTAATGMVALGDLPGGRYTSVATDVSADGNVVVGYSAYAIGDGGLDEFAPFVWDPVNGMRDLRDVFTAAGAAPMPNLRPTHALAISDDGRTITGYGKSVFRTPAGDLRTEAWLGILDEAPGGPPGGGGTPVPAVPGAVGMMGGALLLAIAAKLERERRARDGSREGSGEASREGSLAPSGADRRSMRDAQAAAEVPALGPADRYETP